MPGSGTSTPRWRGSFRGGHPAVSVDTKKKEFVREFKNGGREWHPRGAPLPVRVHDFLDPTQGKAIPYGVYDLALNSGNCSSWRTPPD